MGTAPFLILLITSDSIALSLLALPVDLFGEIMLYKISDRVKEEYGNSYENEADAWEPGALACSIALIILILVAAVS